MSVEYDVLVVGGGVIGASIFFNLTQHSENICLIEKNQIASGCTLYSGGIVRCFHAEIELIDKAVFSWRYYKNFAVNTGIHSDFVNSGFLYFPRLEDVHTCKIVSSKYCQIMQWLDENELQNKFGALLTTSTPGAVYENESGYMDPKHVTNAWVNAGKNNSGKVRTDTSVETFIIKNSKIVGVQTNHGEIKAKKIVLATGANTPKILDQLNLTHSLYSQIIQVDRRMPTTVNISEHPAFIDEVNQLNGRPDLASNCIYIGHPTWKRVNQLLKDNQQDFSHSSLIYKQGISRWQWLLTSKLIDCLRSVDCYTPNSEGFVDLIGYENLYVATGFSGGGFKMAPWIGKQIAKLVSRGK